MQPKSYHLHAKFKHAATATHSLSASVITLLYFFADKHDKPLDPNPLTAWSKFMLYSIETVSSLGKKGPGREYNLGFGSVIVCWR
jgi:hypothetical protein